MTTNNSVGGKNVVTVSQADLDELAKLRGQAEKRAQYRRNRNQRPDVKMKNAEAHERRAKKMKAYTGAMEWLIANEKISAKLMEEIYTEVDGFSEYMGLMAEYASAHNEEGGEDTEEE